MTLLTGNLYNLTSAPYFYSSVKEQGYKGRMRMVEPVMSRNDDPKPVKTRRTAQGTKESSTIVIDYHIPTLKYKVFRRLEEIVLDVYNVPDRNNFAGVDGPPSIAR